MQTRVVARIVLVVLAASSFSRAGRADPIVLYGGAAEQLDFAPIGGLWFGGAASIAARWLDVLEVRADGEISFLARRDTPGHECGEPPCLSGIRVAITPSLGHRFRVGGSKQRPWAFTPSVGLALGAQQVYREPGAAIFDVETPSSWTSFAPGATVSWGPGELRTRVRLPRGDVNAPSFEIAFGVFL